MTKLEDIQNNPADKQIPIDQVGVTDLRYPIVVLDRQQEKQQTVAKLTASVSLPHQFKGTHMSRFIEVLNEHRGEITMRTLPVILETMKDRLEAEKARIELHFPYFLERSAPVSGEKGLMDYDCWFVGEANGSECDFIMRVRIPVATLCPCSKSISDYGAHNQRGHFDIELRSTRKENDEFNFIWIEELIEIAEKSASGPVYALLKRSDERHVTMHAYDNPVFVEDMVRNIAAILIEDERVAWFKVRAENHESIHNHNAFALIEIDKRK
ncbi:GTP cyclohydrolase FolE2 [Thermodesulfobacteriota bacterium]